MYILVRMGYGVRYDTYAAVLSLVVPCKSTVRYGIISCRACVRGRTEVVFLA